jgi:uncharacterized membrane protein YhfC
MDTGLLISILVAAAVEILFPLGLGLWIARRWRVPWKFFFYGVAIFLVFQELTRIPALSYLQPAVTSWLSSSPWAKYAWILFLALTAGLFEEGGRYLGYRFLWKNDDKTWPPALMYGAGHGGVESIVVVGLTMLLQAMSLVSIAQVDPATLTPEQALQFYQAKEAFALIPAWLPLLGALERLMAMAVQVSLSVLVLQVFTRGKGYWWWLALGYHTLVDLVTLLVGSWAGEVMPQSTAALVIEAAVVPFALFSLWLIWRLRPQEAANGPEAGPGVP